MDCCDKLFSITSFIDKARWEDVKEQRGQGRMLINYCDADYFSKNPDARTLTHYLCYITDRQMPFDRIFDIGGYVFSSLVKSYLQSKTTTNELLSINPCGSYVSIDEKENKLKFVCHDKATDSQRHLIGSSYDDDSKRTVFASRFVTTDYKSIYNVLYILENLKKEGIIKSRSLVEFIKRVVSVYPEKDCLLKRIAYALYLLTYDGVSNKLKTDSIEKYLEGTCVCSENQYKKAKSFLLKAESNTGFEEYCKKNIFYSKRIWCSIRDYILDPEYSEYFIPEIKEVLGEDISEIKYLRQLELPGDVWNNNPRYRDCNFKRILNIHEDCNNPLNNALRKWWNGNWDKCEIKGNEYIEQFDITFSLAPRMCANMECGCCPYGLLHDSQIDGTKITHQFERLCIDNINKFCPVVLCSAGYKSNCVGRDSCVLYEIWMEKKM
ncbi:MAG: hypothetical protein K5867_05970 [Bacteroidales bacterium]|nr:hypothetical protein [Bacteroidales bacterium]